MKKISMLLCAVAALGFGAKANAQVNDVSVVISPTAQYTWWDSNLSLNNTPFWGVRAGFGFGPIVELRAVYEQSYDLKGNLKKIDWKPTTEWADKLQDSKANIYRYGGEIKVNLWPNTILTPYLTAGSGIMRFEYDDALPAQKGDKYKEAQLYGSLGAGLKVNLGKRIVLSLEGKNTLFNINEHNRYRNPGIKKDKVLQNWSAGAGLDFYLGGDNYTSESEISKAYRNLYSSGFHGMKFALEPGLMYIDFDKGSKFNDQFFMGGAAGIDFSPLIGIRGFYYQATHNPEKLQFKFNKDMKMYGGNLVARLNFPRGVTPYLNLGGGYLDVTAQSENPNDLKSGYFAFGGVGIEIPFSKYVALYGNANALINQQDNPSVVTKPSDVTVNMMYQAGLRFNIGASNKDGDALYQEQLDSELARQRDLSLEEINALRADKDEMQDRYEKKIASLNDKLADAALRRDTVEIVKVLKEKKEVERQQREETVRAECKYRRDLHRDLKRDVQRDVQPRGTVAITPDQFENLVNKVVRNLEAKNEAKVQSQPSTQSSLSDLDKILLINALQNGQLRNLTSPSVAPQQPAVDENTQKTNALLERMSQVLDKMDQSYNNMMTMNALQNQKVSHAAQVAAEVAAQSAATNSYRDSAPVEKQVVVVSPESNEGVATTSSEAVSSSKGFYGFNKLAILCGASYADGFRGNVGARAYMPVSTTNLEFMPEILVGFGKSTEFDLSANVVYNFDFKSIPVVTPYLGLGIGYFSAVGGVSSNVVVGVSLKNILNGNLFVDYSARGVFEENLLSVGYRFAF